MTYSEEFVADGIDELEEPQYPTAFGITFTPTIIGIICGVLGLLGGGYIMMNFVMPTHQKYQELKNTKEQKEGQIQKDQAAQTKKLKEVTAKLEEAERLKTEIFALFSNEATIDTLLIDLNTIIEESNATLLKFTPQGKEPTIINDGSLGSLVNGKLKRQSIQLEVEGNFAQTKYIMENVERLQPVLLVKKLKSNIEEEPTLLYTQGQLIPQGETKLKTSFQLDVLLPLSEQEQAANQAKSNNKNKGKK